MCRSLATLVKEGAHGGTLGSPVLDVRFLDV
jgi:hypothetical protein